MATIPDMGERSSFNLALEPGATRILQTDGSGDLVAGAATVYSAQAIGVSAIFTVYDPGGRLVSESGVGPAIPLTEFVIPVDVTGEFNTGLALLNRGSTASITITLFDTGGDEVARTTMQLEPFAHVARFVAGPGQLFPSIRSIRGTMVVQSSTSISSIALRQCLSPLSYTSLPVVSTDAGQLSLSLAQVANGLFGEGSFRTSFLIFNLSLSEATVRLALTGDDGSPLSVTIPEKGTSSTYTFSLRPRASVFLQTDGIGPLAAGAARITSNVPIGASAIFSLFDSGGKFLTESGVGDSPVLKQLTLPVDVTGDFNTGVAFFNPGSSPITLTLRMIDTGGTLVGSTVEIPLGTLGHLAKFVTEDDLFPDVRNFRGSLAISATGGVAAVTLRQNSSPISYTTLPVAPGKATGKYPVAPLLPVVVTGISATSDATVNRTLVAGYRLSGTIRGPGVPTGIAAVSSAEVFYGRIDASTSKYLIVLEAGTYTLHPSFTIEKTAMVAFEESDPVHISGDTTHDIALPSTNLTRLSGTISGMNTLPGSLQNATLFLSPTSAPPEPFRLIHRGLIRA